MARKPEKTPPVELDPPADALEAAAAVEVLRAWIADGRLHVTFQADTFAHDAGEWGRLLADMTHHIARGVSLAGSASESEALTLITQAYERGVSQGSTVTAGRVSGRTKH
jgi:hypothetical protein